MSTLNPKRWKEASPFLDQALALSGEERAFWLKSLHEQNSDMALLVQALLEEHRVLAQEHFLEDPVAPPFGRTTLLGQTVGAYTLLSLIGEGGMGSVWVAERSDGRFERRVALKFLGIGLAGRGGEERFKREGTILGRLTHPHIAELLDAGLSPDGRPYLVLEYVEGNHIDQYCDQRGLNVEERTGLFLDVLDAVAHAHANLIVHRDIKPPNVMVRTDGEIKLLDFGIAKLLEGEAQDPGATPLTVEGGRLMTPQYAAPEQLSGGAVTTATDVYALGVLLYILLTGQHPAGGGTQTPADLVKAIIDTEPPRLSEIVIRTRAGADAVVANATRRSTTPDKLGRSLRGDLDTIVAKAMKKNPQERYVSVTAFADDLRRYLRNEPISARSDTVRYRTAKFVRRNRVAVGLAAVALLATIAGIAGTLTQAHTARAQRDFAIGQLSRAEAINELNNFLLSDAAPSGKPFTVNDLLAGAEHIVARQRGGNPEDRVELLISIGRQYWTLEEASNARRLLTEAYELSLGLHDSPTRAKAACALATVVSSDGEGARAEALIQEGLHEIPSESQFALNRIFCLLRGSNVAEDRGDSKEGIARVQAAQQVLWNSPFDSLLMEMHTVMDLAEAYRTAGQYREAIAAFEQASLLMTSLGRDDTENAGTLFNNWAMALLQTGRVLESETVFRRAIDISRADKTERAVSPMLLTNYARTLRELARLDEAVDYAQRAYAKAREEDHQVVMNQSLLLLAWIYCDKHDPVKAAATLAEVEPRLRRNLPPSHYAFATLASVQSLVAMLRDEHETALRLADQAIAIDEAAIKAGGQGAPVLPWLLLRRSAIELESKRLEEARTDAGRALSLLQATAQPGTFSSNLGRAYLTLAYALQAEGKRDQAQAAGRSATEHLQNTLGSEHPEVRAARQLADSATQLQ
jgi:serine/threonine protein kinase/tetratricopeptide (TPR) repeat protein